MASFQVLNKINFDLSLVYTMMITLILFILIPVVLSNSLHMLIVKRDVFPWLARPVSVRLFGANKTYRGFLLLPLLNGLVTFLIAWAYPVPLAVNAFLFGALLGLVYMLSELPNSWLKRRAGIPPGGQSDKYRLLFILLDKSDSVIGVSLAAYFVLKLSVTYLAILIFVGIGVHLLVSWLLLKVGIKKGF